MLRILLVHAPARDRQVAALADALSATPLTDCYAPPALLAVAHTIGAPHALEGVSEARLERPEGALSLIESIAATSEGAIALVVEEAVARAVVARALDAPVADDRLAFDPGAYAEIEVRLDSPWTVNRLNDRCHLDV